MHTKEITARIEYACLHVFYLYIFYLINKGTILEKIDNYVNKLIKDWLVLLCLRSACCVALNTHCKHTRRI